MVNISQYKFVSLNEGNCHHLISLYKNIFNVTYSLDQVRSKYLSDYTGIHAQGHFAFYEGDPVAFHGAIPVLMEHKGQIELAAQYGDAMTLKEHAGKGLFTKLGVLTDKLLQSLDVKFVWGFPNQNSEYGYVNKLGWQGTERMKCFILPVKTLPSEMILRRLKLFAKRSQKRINKKISPLVIAKKDGVCSSNSLGGVNRSKEYYEYKSFTPNFFVQLKSAKVWVKPLGGLLVGDMEVTDAIQVESTLIELQELAQKLGLNKVVFQISPDTLLYQILISKYSPVESWLIGYKSFNSQFPLDKLKFTYGDLDTF